MTRTSSARRSPAPADIVTYRLDGKMMYVPPASSFEQAVTFARSAFEGELTGVDQSRISFWLNVVANGKHGCVGISPLAWPAVGSRLARYEIIDVRIQPEIKVSSPPSYQSHSEINCSEKAPHSAPSSPHTPRPSLPSHSSGFDLGLRRLFH